MERRYDRETGLRALTRTELDAVLDYYRAKNGDMFATAQEMELLHQDHDHAISVLNYGPDEPLDLLTHVAWERGWMHAEFQIDSCGAERFPGRWRGQRWNGFATPEFTKEVGLRYCEAYVRTASEGNWAPECKLVQAFYDPEEDAFRVYDPWNEEWDVFGNEGDGWYAIGAFCWGWMLVEQE
jgi:hypothetical protein